MAASPGQRANHPRHP